MTRRILLTTLFGIGSLLLAADSCAASPLPGGSPVLRDRVAGYEMTVLVDGLPAPTYTYDGQTYLLGRLGARYTLRVANPSGRRIEAVVSIDGRDVIDGKPADFRGKRGYLVPAWGSIDIDGWRISHAEAAAFRFSSVPDSYAARTGSAREVGVIGVAVFPERYVPPPVVYPPRQPLAPPESPRGSYDHASEGVAGAPAAPPPAAQRAARKSSTSDESERDAAPASVGNAKGRGEAQASAGGPAKRARPGLGTEYGEAISSPIYEVEFVRANSSRPAALLGARYNDRDGLLAMGIPVDGDACASDADLRLSAEPFPAVDRPARSFAAPPPGWRRACGWR
jgi:hypothetical protein